MAQPLDKKAATFRLSAEARRLLELLSARDGINMTSVLEKMIREKARAEGLGSAPLGT